jgi:hypothetical protein
VASSDCTRFNNNSFCARQRCYPTSCIENQQCPPSTNASDLSPPRCNTTLGLCVGSEQGPDELQNGGSPSDQDKLNVAVFLMMYIFAALLVGVVVLAAFRYKKVTDIVVADTSLPTTTAPEPRSQASRETKKRK